eukprot:1017753-Ditylum_brightwellii.AAC.2
MSGTNMPDQSLAKMMSKRRRKNMKKTLLNSAAEISVATNGLSPLDSPVKKIPVLNHIEKE